MQLKGKCKEDFEEYFSNNENKILELKRLDSFYSYPESMKWGVYVDFFSEQAGLEIYVERSVDDNINYLDIFEWVVINIHTNENYGCGETENTRQQARSEAINKANDIYNEKTSRG